MKNNIPRLQWVALLAVVTLCSSCGIAPSVIVTVRNSSDATVTDIQYLVDALGLEKGDLAPGESLRITDDLEVESNLYVSFKHKGNSYKEYLGYFSGSDMRYCSIVVSDRRVINHCDS